jgi:hypothetical protein
MAFQNRGADEYRGCAGDDGRACAEKRVAPVIGNNDHGNVP